MTGKNGKTAASEGPNLGRHRAECRICAHPQRQEIERDFISWKSPATIATDYGLANRSSVYRHAHAFDLFAKRARNIRAALERIIEKVDEVEVTGAVVVQAITAYARINAQGQLIERNENINLNELFDQMSRTELEAYARECRLPAWFSAVVGATGTRGPGGSENA